MKKRLFSLVLVLALCLGLTVHVFAENTDDPLAKWNRDIAPKTGLTMFSEKDPTAQRPWYETVYGLKDGAGNVVVPAKYARFELLGNDRIVVCRQWLEEDFYDAVGYGVVDLQGNFLLPCTGDHGIIDAPNDGNRTIRVNFKDSYSNRMGKNSIALYDWNLNQILPPEYSSIVYCGDDLYALGKNNGIVYVLETPEVGVYKYGKGITIPVQYENVYYIGSERFCVRNYDNYCGVLDGDGRQLMPFVFADVNNYKDGFYIAALFRDKASYDAVQAQGVYSNGSPALFQHVGSAVVEGWGYDMSKIPSYAVWGVVDEDLNTYSNFTHERVEFSGSSVQLGAWNGQHKLQDVFNGAMSGLSFTIHAKVYDFESLPLSSLKITEKTVPDLLQKNGIAPSGMTPLPNPTVCGFTDIKSSDYYADAVLWAVEKNITSGTSKTTFSPNATCSKAQILSFLWRANGSPEPTAANPFTDVKTNDYFYKAALWAAEKGLVSGSTFGANTDCTRAMTMEYMWKAAGSPAASYNGKFNDVPASADYAQAVAWAVENKITSGTGGSNFSPAATCTRGQIVTFLHRAMGK